MTSSAGLSGTRLHATTVTSGRVSKKFRVAWFPWKTSLRPRVFAVFRDPLYGIDRRNRRLRQPALAGLTAAPMPAMHDRTSNWQSAANGGDVRRIYPWGEVFDRNSEEVLLWT